MANLSNINNKFLFTDGDFLKIGNLAPINNISGTESGISITNSNVASITLDNTAASGKRYIMYSSGNGSLVFWDGDAASARLQIDSSGNSTFAGTIDAGGRIKVSGGSTDQYYFEGARTGVGVTYRLYDNANNIYHDSWSAQIIRLNQNGGSGGNLIITGGDVGIGTSAPIEKLQVRTDTTTDNSFQGINVMNFGQTATRAGISFKCYDWVQSAIWHGRGTSAAYNGALVLGTNPNTSDLTVGGVTGRMWILNNGYVGIGTGTPGQKLEVAGRIRVTTDPTLEVYEASNKRGGFQWDSTNDWVNIFSTGGDMRFDLGGERMRIQATTGNVGIGTTSPDGKLEVAGGTTLGFRLSNAGDSAAYDQVRMTYGGYNSGAPTVTFMPLTTPGGGNVDTTFHFMNTNGLNANNNRANVNIDGILNVGSGRQSGETTLIMRNYDDTLVDSNEIQNSIRMSGRYWSGSASQLVETRINSVHQESNGNGGSALTFWTQTGGSAATEQVRIDKIGQVGIGTDSPTAKLDINGTVRYRGSIYNQLSYQVTGSYSANTWYTFATSATLTENGIYILTAYIEDFTAGGGNYYTYVASTNFYWVTTGTNRTTAFNFPPMLGTGHATGVIPSIRITQELGTSGALSKLQWQSSYTYTSLQNAGGKILRFDLKRIGA
jgi:hypothetical protein